MNPGRPFPDAFSSLYRRAHERPFRVVVTAALRREIKSLERMLGMRGSAGTRPGGHSIFTESMKIFPVVTGIGGVRAQSRLEKALNELDPHVVLSAGFGGGLTPNLGPGRVISVVRIGQYTHGGAAPASFHEPSFSVEAWTRQREGVQPGTVITVDDPIPKRLLSRLSPMVRHPAVVDMETAYLARMCHERGIPFGALRVVCDEWGFEPEIDLRRILSPDGRVDPGKAVRYAFQDGRRVVRFVRLARRSFIAARSLALAVHGILHSLDAFLASQSARST